MGTYYSNLHAISYQKMHIASLVQFMSKNPSRTYLYHTYTVKPRFWNNPRFWNTFAANRNFYYINQITSIFEYFFSKFFQKMLIFPHFLGKNSFIFHSHFL